MSNEWQDVDHEDVIAEQTEVPRAELEVGFIDCPSCGSALPFRDGRCKRFSCKNCGATFFARISHFDIEYLEEGDANG